jgi:hypothetical protein
MRWRFWRKPEPEIQVPEWGAWVLRRRDEGGYETVFVERPEPAEPISSGYVVQPRIILSDPLDIAPAFHMRYEKVYTPNFVNLVALKRNVYTFKLQAKEVVTDPKRVARRHWHRHLIKVRQARIIEDSRLFW